jgi:hypothetical protein
MHPVRESGSKKISGGVGEYSSAGKNIIIIK